MWKLDLIGLVAALLAGFEGWAQVRHDHVVAVRYRNTARALALHAAGADDVADETDWAAFVRQVEDVLLNENASWRTTLSSD